jgi:hypothetical protein
VSLTIGSLTRDPGWKFFLARVPSEDMLDSLAILESNPLTGEYPHNSMEMIVSKANFKRILAEKKATLLM